MRSFEMITKLATEADAKWSNKEKVLFHYFNPNGMLAKKRATDELINAAVDAGKAKTGAIIAYGSMNHFNEDRLYQMLDLKRVDRIKLKVVLEMLASDIKAATKFLETV